MLTVNQDFRDAITSTPRNAVGGYLKFQDGTEFYPEDDLQKFTIDSVGGFLRTGMSKITITLLGKHIRAGQALDVYYGPWINGAYDYILKGKFIVADVDYKEDNNTTILTGYDNMKQFDTDYISIGEYPMSLYNFLQAICSVAGVVLENSTIYNGSLTMEEDYYANVNEYTVRDVLEDVCEASASYAIINSEGNLELRQIADTGEEITYHELLKYKYGDYWGDINSLVLSRQPQNDDVYLQDEDDINTPTTRNILDLTRFNVGYSMEEE